MGYHDIHDLEIRYGGEDEDDARDYCDDRDHFTDLTDYVTQKLGYFGIKWSVVHDNYYGDDWEYFQCPEIGRQGKKPLVALLEEDNEIEYLRHGVVQQATWELGSDNRERSKKKLTTICVSYQNGSDYIEVRTHPVGECDYLLYEHQIMRDKKIRIDATFYLHLKCRDKEHQVDNKMDEAINMFMDADRLVDCIYDEVTYELDDDPVITTKLDRLKWKEVPKTRKI
jgi:hypothetical protein